MNKKEKFKRIKYMFLQMFTWQQLSLHLEVFFENFIFVTNVNFISATTSCLQYCDTNFIVADIAAWCKRPATCPSKYSTQGCWDVHLQGESSLFDHLSISFMIIIHPNETCMFWRYYLRTYSKCKREVSPTCRVQTMSDKFFSIFTDHSPCGLF